MPVAPRRRRPVTRARGAIAPSAIVTALGGFSSGVPASLRSSPCCSPRSWRRRRPRDGACPRARPPRGGRSRRRLRGSSGSRRRGRPDDQPAVGVDRDPDVDGPMGHDRVVGPGGVQQRMRPDRSADCRDDDRQGDTSCSRRATSSAVASTVRNVVTWGIAAACSSRRAIVRRIEETGSARRPPEHPRRPLLFPRLDVVCRHATARPAARERREVHAQILRELRTAGVAATCPVVAGDRPSPRVTSPPVRRRAPGSPPSPPHPGRRRRGTSRGARRPPPRPRHPRAASRSLPRTARDLDGRFRRLHLDERLVQRHIVALATSHAIALLEPLAEVGHREHAIGHQYASTPRIASTIRSTLGR